MIGDPADQFEDGLIFGICGIVRNEPNMGGDAGCAQHFGEIDHGVGAGFAGAAVISRNEAYGALDGG